MQLEEIYSLARRGRGTLSSSSVRDLTVLELGGGFSVVVAVDSDGGIGPRANDVVQVSDHVLGRFAMRVPLMEILCSGAVPMAAFDMLTVSMTDGSDIIRGIRDELAEAGLPEDFPLSGSAEDNVPTSMTGVGTAVLGLVHSRDLRPGTSQTGDRVFCAGRPKSAPEDEVRLDDPEIVQQSQIRTLLDLDGVHDALPVGSRGIRHEAEELVRSAGLTFAAFPQESVDLEKSAGPSTCLIFSVTAAQSDSLAQSLSLPITEIGEVAPP